MAPITQRSPVIQTLLVFAALVVVIAGMKVAAPILVPFLLSGFIAIIAAPPMFWLHRKGLPMGLSLATVISAVLLAALLLGLLVGASVDDFTRSLPEYQTNIRAKLSGLLSRFDAWGVPIDKAALLDTFDPSSAMHLAGQTLAGFGGVFANTFLILFTVIFLLLEAAGLPHKLRTVFKNPDGSMARLGDIAEKVQRYVELKALMSLGTALSVGLWVWIVGLDYPLIWGVLAFLLNFVPNIGSILAAAPAVLLAMVQLSWGGAAAVLAGYAAANVFWGNVVEPRVMGRDLELSTLVVFLSLVFWGWVLGTVGMLLSVPLTITVKIVLDANEDTRWIAVLLGPDVAASDDDQAG